MSEDGSTPTADSSAGTAATTTGTPPGWYPDPQGALRWWDGAAWTSHVHAGSGTSVTRTATILSTAPPESTSRATRLPQLPALPQLRRRTWVVGGAVVGVLVLLAGYLLFGRGGDDAGPAAAGPVVHHLPPQQVVQKVALTNADLTGGLRVSLIKGGDQFKGQVTLDICGYPYTSEAHRVARRQVEVDSAKRQFTGISNEVVVYDSPASAAKALTELRTALAHCPHTYVRDGTAPHPMVLYSTVHSTNIPATKSVSPPEVFDEGVGFTWTTRVKGQARPTYEAAFVIRRGAVVSYTWFASVTPISQDTARIVAGLADVTARRLPAG